MFPGTSRIDYQVIFYQYSFNSYLGSMVFYIHCISQCGVVPAAGYGSPWGGAIQEVTKRFLMSSVGSRVWCLRSSRCVFLGVL
jgi:hypothetical protein